MAPKVPARLRPARRLGEVVSSRVGVACFTKDVSNVAEPASPDHRRRPNRAERRLTVGRAGRFRERACCGSPCPETGGRKVPHWESPHPLAIPLSSILKAGRHHWLIQHSANSPAQQLPSAGKRAPADDHFPRPVPALPKSRMRRLFRVALNEHIYWRWAGLLFVNDSDDRRACSLDSDRRQNRCEAPRSTT